MLELPMIGTDQLSNAKPFVQPQLLTLERIDGSSTQHNAQEVCVSCSTS